MPEINGKRYSIRVDTLVHAARGKVWDLLVDPAKLGALFWGSTVVSDFRIGSPIVWKGLWEGKPFEDRGQVLEREDGSFLKYSHWTPSPGTPDEDIVRSILTFRLTEEQGGVRVVFLHDNIATLQMKDHSEPLWRQLLERLKETLEKAAP
jgi:uncharacterized protein YndB with AHSA1/START domain